MAWAWALAGVRVLKWGRRWEGVGNLVKPSAGELRGSK